MNCSAYSSWFFFLNRLDVRPKGCEGPQPWMHNRAGWPLGRPCMGTLWCATRSPCGNGKVVSWQFSAVNPLWGLFWLKITASPKVTALSKGSPYLMTDPMQDRKAWLPHTPGTTEGSTFASRRCSPPSPSGHSWSLPLSSPPSHRCWPTWHSL